MTLSWNELFQQDDDRKGVVSKFRETLINHNIFPYFTYLLTFIHRHSNFHTFFECNAFFVHKYIHCTLLTSLSSLGVPGVPWHTVDQIPKKCKETSNSMWLSLIWFILVLFICWNLFCTIANLRIKCVTETKNASVLFYKNLKSSFFTWLTHLTLRFLYIVGCSGPRCAAPPSFHCATVLREIF